MLANINLLEYIDLILDWGSSSCPSPAKKRLALNKKYCWIAGNFFPTACALIGYFEVTWHLTIKLFPAKISRRATLQNLWCQRVTVHCYLRMLTDDRSYIHRRNLLISFSQPFLCYHRASSQGRPCLYVIKIKLWNELISMSRFNHFFKWLKRVFEAIQFTFLLNS